MRCRKSLARKIQLILLLFFAIIPSISLQAADKDALQVVLVRVYDGDTFTVNIPELPAIFGKEIGIRINGIDTPEMTDKRENIHNLAIEAKEYLLLRLETAEKITLTNIKRDKYFRLNATVLVDGSDIAIELLDLNLAKQYDGGTKQAW